jgi:hypothetical protein
VQLVKGGNFVNTKKKIKMDSSTKVATFNDKITMVTSLEKDATDPQGHLF